MEQIVLLHGALGAARSMQPLVNVLKIDAEVHVIDFAGHGQAAWPEAGLSIEVFEEDVLRMMDERGLESAHIFGYSMGGFVGLRLAARVPQRIKTLVTLASKLDWTEESCAKESGGLNAELIEAKVPKFAASLDSLHALNGWKKLVDGTKDLILGMSRYRFADEAYAGIEVPVRLLLGDRDKMVSLEETQGAYRAIPNAEMGILPGTPHPLEQADLLLLTDMILSKVYKK